MITPKQLSHVSFLTQKLEETITFYQKHFGSEVVHEFKNEEGERYGVFLSFGNRTYIEFFNTPDKTESGNKFRHLCIEVVDIQAAAKYLNSSGFKVEVKRGKTDKVLQCFFSDPNGIEIELHQYDEQAVAFK